MNNDINGSDNNTENSGFDYDVSESLDTSSLNDISDSSSISSSTASGIETDRGIPSAVERETGNKNKLIAMAMLMAGIAAIVIGGIVFAKQYEARKLAQKMEAEKNEKKEIRMKDPIDLENKKSRVERNAFNDLPPPKIEEVKTEEQPVIVPVQQEQPKPEPKPVQPTYNSYDTQIQPNYGQVTPPVIPEPAPQPFIPPQAEPAPRVLPPLNIKPEKTPQQVKEERAMSGDILVFKPDGKGDSKNGKNSLNKRLQSSTLLATSAKQRGNLSMLLNQGHIIPCALKNRIVSTYQGFVSCQVTTDVYSANGRVVLVDKGSTIFGEQRVALKQGQSRVFVLWTNLETPQGISVNLESPAVGALGATGANARVDTHFWKRFGGALMLSLIQDVFANVANKVGDNETTTENTQDNTEAFVEKALENTINIEPTGYVHQGAIVNVMVARDVDFGGVYELSRTN